MVVLRIDGLEGVSSTIQLRGDRIKVVGLSLGVREKQYRSNTVNGQHSPCYGKSKRDNNALREAMNGFVFSTCLLEKGMAREKDAEYS